MFLGSSPNLQTLDLMDTNLPIKRIFLLRGPDLKTFAVDSATRCLSAQISTFVPLTHTLPVRALGDRGSHPATSDHRQLLAE